MVVLRQRRRQCKCIVRDCDARTRECGFARNLDAEASDEFLEWFYEQQREMLLAAFELRADCLETLTALREEGLYLSIVSNIDDDYLHPMVKRVGLDALLDDWTSNS